MPSACAFTDKAIWAQNRATKRLPRFLNQFERAGAEQMPNRVHDRFRQAERDLEQAVDFARLTGTNGRALLHNKLPKKL
jgi:hypothetical protein